MRWTLGPDELRLPSDDDEPTPKTTRQAVTIFYCFDCLRSHWRGQRDVFVGADQFIHRVPDYDPKTNPDKPPIAPDVYVAFGVANRHRGSYVPWEEGKVPDFVMEVAAPWSREQDAEEKPGIYAEMGVPEFFLYDPDDCLDPRRAEAEKAKLEAEKAKLEAEKAKLEEETAALEAETAKMESEAAEAQTQTKVAELEALAEKLRRD